MQTMPSLHLSQHLDGNEHHLKGNCTHRHQGAEVDPSGEELLPAPHRTQLSEHIEWLTDKIEQRAKGKKIILVFNKIDKIAEEERDVLNLLFEQFEGERIYISAKNKLHTDELKKSLVEAAQLPTLQPGDVVVNNIRHYEALQKALASIRRVKDGLESGISGDFLSQDIRECMHFLGEITGQISNDEILGNIFGKFCIGK
jgi:tRNA modification GTPase